MRGTTAGERGAMTGMCLHCSRVHVGSTFIACKWLEELHGGWAHQLVEGACQAKLYI